MNTNGNAMNEVGNKSALNGKNLGAHVAISSDASSMTVNDVMHEGVVSCDSSLGLPEAAKLMLESKMRSLVVVDADCGLAGIVSQSDMVNARLLHAESKQWDHLAIRDIMTSMVLTVTPAMPIKEAARVMIEHRIHRVVVADVNDPCHPLGVLSMGDIMRHMMD
jgi:acetoin utilization protein AcuB